MTTKYTARDLFTLLARLAKPITDAIAAELPRKPAAQATPATIPTPEVAAVVEPVTFVPENAAAFAMPAGYTIPAMPPYVEPAPKAARKPRAPRKSTARDQTGTHGTLRFDDATKTVAIKTGRTECRYAVAETATDWNGRAFRLDKIDAGSDRESTSYCVFISRDAATPPRCDCKGFEMGKGKNCKHVNAVKALTETSRV